MINFNTKKIKKTSDHTTKVSSSPENSIKHTRVVLTENNKEFLRNLGFRLL